jgi:hypothetical protein
MSNNGLLIGGKLHVHGFQITEGAAGCQVLEA